MDFRDLGYFEVIAETGHLGRAADRLGRTQPALTKSVQRLESAIGAKLFARAGRGIALTAVGEVLLGCARQMRSTMDVSLREVRAFASGKAGHVRIGMGPTMGEYLLPQVCSALIAAAPDITIRIFIGMDAVLRSNLRAGSLDILVSPVLAGEEREFMIDVFNQDAVVVVAAHGHPLCGRPVTIHDLAPYRWVLPDRSVGMRQWLDRMFEANGILGPSVQIETNSIVMLPRLIVETELLSFTSTRNLSPSRIGQYVEPLKLDITTMRRHFGIVQRRDIFPSPAVSRVAALLLEKGRLLEREA
ncbi:MAG: transcriptional regulator, LysR family [Nitrobacter vulgaris]|nr:transcriptional regulator, LysR family [Nitrobacter vulgaris]